MGVKVRERKGTHRYLSVGLLLLFHDLRHTFASHFVMAGVPLLTVGQILGHKTPAMTMRYSHLSPGYLKQAVGSLPPWGSGTKVAQVASGGMENA